MPAPAKRGRTPLGQILKQRGMVRESAIQEALAVQRKQWSRLPLFVRGGDRTSVRLYEQLVRSSSGVVVQSAQRPYAFMQARHGRS